MKSLALALIATPSASAVTGNLVNSFDVDSAVANFEALREGRSSH